MRILIDNHIGIEVRELVTSSAEDGRAVVLDFDESYKLLEAWVAADPAHRNYRYGTDESAAEPDNIIVAYVQGHNGSLVMETIAPFWDGSYTLNAYDLEVIRQAFPVDAVQWGEAIGEEAP